MRDDENTHRTQEEKDLTKALFPDAGSSSDSDDETPNFFLEKDDDNKKNLDFHEESEVINSGVIKNAIHIPRGLLEFKLAPNSLSNPRNIDKATNLFLYCAGGYRSALAAKTLLEIGFTNVYNIGGYGEWIDNGGDIQASP